MILIVIRVLRLCCHSGNYLLRLNLKRNLLTNCSSSIIYLKQWDTFLKLSSQRALMKFLFKL